MITDQPMTAAQPEPEKQVMVYGIDVSEWDRMWETLRRVEQLLTPAKTGLCDGAHVLSDASPVCIRCGINTEPGQGECGDLSPEVRLNGNAQPRYVCSLDPGHDGEHTNGFTSWGPQCGEECSEGHTYAGRCELAKTSAATPATCDCGFEHGRPAEYDSPDRHPPRDDSTPADPRREVVQRAVEESVFLRRKLPFGMADLDAATDAVLAALDAHTTEQRDDSEDASRLMGIGTPPAAD